MATKIDPSPASGRDRRHQVAVLRDGRRLGYAEYGRAGGRPVFFFHGSLETRLCVHPDADARLSKLGISLVAVDRPGFGLSDFQPARTFADWPADVDALADRLGIREYAVIGWSGGGPHALVCGALSSRVRHVTTIGSAAPFDWPGAIEGMAPLLRRGIPLARSLPFPLLRFLYERQFGAGREHPERIYDMLFTPATPPSDLAIVRRPEVRTMMVGAVADAFRQGARGAAWEGRMLARPWGFDVASIHVPVSLWHGTADDAIPINSAKLLHGRLSDSELHVLDGEGHFLFLEHLDDILEEAVGN